MKRLRVVVLAVIGSAVFAVLTVFTLRSVVALPSDAYAADWTAVFVIEHLKSSDNLWPGSWDDLHDEFDRMAEPTHYAWTFDELQQRVDLRFDVTAQQVQNADPPLVVFQLTSGRMVSYNGDSNLLIRDYLKAGLGGMDSIRRSK
jgi:hypothetical protein